MAEPIAAALTSPSRTVDGAPRASLGVSASIVIAFWWAATGLTLAMQWSDAARVASLVATTALGGYGVALIVTTRDDTTVRGARLGFLGAAFLWWWNACIFYAGWGIDLAHRSSAPAGSLALALDAIAATWRVDSVGVVTLVALAATVRHRRNHVALWAFATFWGTLQTAKLNVFFGVRNSGAEMLPARLAGLGAFFGPARNSAFLAVTVLALAAACVVLAALGRRSRRPFDRHAIAMVATLMGLALLEHALLGVSSALPLWDVFLRQGS